MIRHASERVATWSAERAHHGAMLVALDFDGTLAPIVPRPDDAAILEESRAAMAALAARPDTRVAVVSGRGLDDARARVGLEGIFYAGNHGLEIEGPGVHRVHAEARAARPALEECAASLQDLAATIDGVLVEDKGLTLSVHYRLVRDPKRAAEVVRHVRRRCRGRAGLIITEGKKIVEVRPDVDWDKGRATRFLIDQLLPAGPVVYIGDDRTDEDAFRAIAGRGEGVVVADPPPSETAASGYVRTPHEVAQLLDELARS